MKPSRRVTRRRILSRMFDHLQTQYCVQFSRATFVDGQLTMHDLDAVLAFKSDPQLDELRLALERLEEGSYGICMMCKGAIGQETLDSEPACRFCEKCERTLFPYLAEHYTAHTAT